MKVLVSEKLSEHKYKTPEGYLICTDAILARTGKQSYTKDELFCDGDNTEVEVDRPYDEVMSAKTIASFENKPITFDHPDEDVNVGNYKSYSVGYVRDVRQGKTDKGEDVILGNLVITDQDAINAIEQGDHTDLSCGYDCDIKDDGNGNYSQTNIRGNHLALCEQGRAGIAHIVDSKINDSYYIDFSDNEGPFSDRFECERYAKLFNLKVIANPQHSSWTISGKKDDLRRFLLKYYNKDQLEMIVDSKVEDSLSVKEKKLCNYMLENALDDGEDENDLLKKMKVYYSEYSNLARSKPNEVLQYFKSHINDSKVEDDETIDYKGIKIGVLHTSIGTLYEVRYNKNKADWPEYKKLENAKKYIDIFLTKGEQAANASWKIDDTIVDSIKDSKIDMQKQDFEQLDVDEEYLTREYDIKATSSYGRVIITGDRQDLQRFYNDYHLRDYNVRIVDSKARDLVNDSEELVVGKWYDFAKKIEVARNQYATSLRISGKSGNVYRYTIYLKNGEMYGSGTYSEIKERFNIKDSKVDSKINDVFGEVVWQKQDFTISYDKNHDYCVFYKDNLIESDYDDINYAKANVRKYAANIEKFKKMFGIKDSVEDSKVEDDNWFKGHINGDLQSYNIDSLINNVKSKKQPLHTNLTGKSGSVYTVFIDGSLNSNLDDGSNMWIDIIVEKPDGQQKRLLSEKFNSWNECQKIFNAFKNKVRDSKVEDSKLNYDTLKEIKSDIYIAMKGYWQTVFSDEWFDENAFSLAQDYHDEKTLILRFKIRKEAYFRTETDFEKFKAGLTTIPDLKLKKIHKKSVKVPYYDNAKFTQVDEITFQYIGQMTDSMRDDYSIKEIEDAEYTYKLTKKKNDYDEYVIQAYKNGKKNEDATYYTDDWDDAINTLKSIAKQEKLTFRQQGSVFVADNKAKVFNDSKESMTMSDAIKILNIVDIYKKVSK